MDNITDIKCRLFDSEELPKALELCADWLRKNDDAIKYIWDVTVTETSDDETGYKNWIVIVYCEVTR